MRVMSKKEGKRGGGFCQGRRGWEAYVKGRKEGGMGGLCQGKKGRAVGREWCRERG